MKTEKGPKVPISEMKKDIPADLEDIRRIREFCKERMAID